MTNLTPGDIVFLTYSAFSGSVGKNLVRTHHMFIILSNQDNEIVVSPISSRMNKVSDKYPLSIAISDYAEANLRKPSYTDISVQGTISDTQIHKVVGHVSLKDQRKIISNYYKTLDELRIVLEQAQMVLEFYKKGYNNHEL